MKTSQEITDEIERLKAERTALIEDFNSEKFKSFLKQEKYEILIRVGGQISALGWVKS